MKYSAEPLTRDATTGSPLWGVLGAAHALEARLEALLGQMDLSLAKLSVLRVLAAAKQSLTLGELAERNQCVRSNITQLVDRLEADGLVRRENDPDDRRVRRAGLTTAGRTGCSEALRLVAVAEREVAVSLGPEASGQLMRALGRLAG